VVREIAADTQISLQNSEMLVVAQVQRTDGNHHYERFKLTLCASSLTLVNSIGIGYWDSKTLRQRAAHQSDRRVDHGSGIGCPLQWVTARHFAGHANQRRRTPSPHNGRGSITLRHERIGFSSGTSGPAA